jgi:membrane-bound serine protease (ClpP class)
MDFLLNPNVAYLLLVATLLLAFLAVLVPGTGLIELLALFGLVFAGYTASRLTINWWALPILLLSLVPFILAVRRSGRAYYLALSILALVVGSAFFFKGEGWAPAVDPLLAFFTSSLVAVFLWVVSRKAIEAFQKPPSIDVNQLIGLTGEATTEIHTEGTVQLQSELWSAQSAQIIPAGSRVRVIGREGFILQVEKD